MATVIVLKITQIPADTVNGFPAQQAADLAITNDNVTFYHWSMAGIAANADVQATVNAIANDLFAAAQAAGHVITTGTVRAVERLVISNDNPIDGLVSGPQLIATIQGGQAYYAGVRYRIIVLPGTTGSGTPPTVSMGTNSPSYNNIAAATALGSLGLTGDLAMRNVFINTTVPVIASDVSVFANVSVVATGYTVYKIRVDLVFDAQVK